MLNSRRGFVQLYTGNGKGKTTAAIGLAVRALGAGFRVAFVQFLKSRPSSEHRILRSLKHLDLFMFGRPAWVKKALPADIRQGRLGMSRLREALHSGKYDLVVADELCTAVQVGVLPETEVCDLLRHRPPNVELILTGRGAGPVLTRLADLVTEMKARKHYYLRGVQARSGIEF